MGVALWPRIPDRALLWGPAPIDWCEENRPASNPLGVQEWHNTLTNLAYVIVGVALAYQSRRVRLSRSHRLIYIGFCLACVATGVTSMWFHASLVYAAQKADEFSENAAVICLCHLAAPASTEARAIVAASAHALLLGCAVLAIPELFCEVHLLFAVLVGFARIAIRLRELPAAYRAERDALSRIFARSAALAAAGFACWLVDMLWCTPLVRRLLLHAYAWHILTALSLHEGGRGSLALAALRLHVAERAIKHRRS